MESPDLHVSYFLKSMERAVNLKESQCCSADFHDGCRIIPKKTWKSHGNLQDISCFPA